MSNKQQNTYFRHRFKMPQQQKNKKKKKGKKPAHQNKFAFQHNPKSKLTEKILSSPNQGVCRRCHDKIEWRKKYRKYKPLTKQPGRCNICLSRNVYVAYHTICSNCAIGPTALGRIQQSGGDEDKGILAKDEEKSDVDEAQGITSNFVGDCNLDDNRQCENQTRSNLDECIRACAICVKVPALPDNEDEASKLEKNLKSEIDKMEKRIGRKLKLREEKAIERKYKKKLSLLRVSKVEKEEEGQPNEHHDAGVEGDSVELTSEDDDAVSSTTDCRKEENELQENTGECNDSTQVGATVEEGGNDPFLMAVGGAEKLLTGDAYRQMLLQQQQQQ